MFQNVEECLIIKEHVEKKTLKALMLFNGEKKHITKIQKPTPKVV